MSIASELTRILAGKADSIASVEAKGSPVPPGTLIDELPPYIDAITAGSPTEPAAFVTGYWTATLGNAQVVVNITALPSTGGSAITALQYRLNGGTVVNFTGTGTGSRTISGLTNGTPYDIEIRAVNAIGNGPWSDVKTRTPEAPAGNIVSTLLAGAPFGFAIVPGDTSLTRCYVETTGASASTPCVDTNEIGTIHCLTSGQYITYPTGVKPVFRTASGASWIEMQAGGKLFHQQTAYAGAGDMIMSGAFIRAASQTGNPMFLGAGNGTNPLWDSSQRGGVQLSGLGIDTLRDGGGPIPSFGVSTTESVAIRSVIGELAVQTNAWKSGGTSGVYSSTWASKGGWNVNRAYFGSAPDDTAIFEGRIYGALVVRVDADSGELASLATYMGALIGLTI